MSGFSPIGCGTSAIDNAQLGISRGMSNFTRDAQTVAGGSSASASGNAVTGALLDARQQALDVEASARALSIADQMLGTLLDVTA